MWKTFFAASLLGFLATSVSAQTPVPQSASAEDLLPVLLQQRNDQMNQVAVCTAQLGKINKELEAVKATLPKPSVPKDPAK